jgi:protein-tyrosine sulfotransferase
MDSTQERPTALRGAGTSLRGGFQGMRLDEPVIVLACGRSGSTLLRFILDAHPALACPPETRVVDICTEMGLLSMVLDGPAAGARSGLSELGIASIRSWVTAVFGTYLVRFGKLRWCEKSLNAAGSADRFLDIFPKTKFICLYRHCMDVIDSVHEACPWGLRGYGLEEYAALHPSNSVAAVADYWATNTLAIAEFERQYPQSCLRVRYEDLVRDPDTQAKQIFTFLGEEPVPVAGSALRLADREQVGPSDHKIWETSSVHASSVGRGVRVPPGAIPPPVVEMINELLDELGYQTIDEHWDEQPVSPALAGQPAPPREPAAAGLRAQRAMAGQVQALDQLEELLVPRAAERMAAPYSRQLPGRSSTDSFLIIATVPSSQSGAAIARCWRADLAAASIGRVLPADPATAADRDGEWGVTADVGAWESVLEGQLSLATALRHGRVRYTSPDTSPDADAPMGMSADPRAAVLACLLAPALADRPVQQH